MPSSNLIEKCSETYFELEQKLDEAMENLVREAARGEQFFFSIERAEEQIEYAKKMLVSRNDLDLNETAVITEKIELDIGEAEKYAFGAALAETEEEWAVELESAKHLLEKLAGSLRKMKEADSEGDALEARSHLLSFNKNAAACKKALSNIKKLAERRDPKVYSRIRSVKAKVVRLKEEVGKAFDRIAKARLKARIEDAKKEILGIVKRFGNGRIFIDQKHLTISNGRHVERIPLSQSVRYALEEIIPIRKPLAKIGKNGRFILGEYRKESEGTLLRIGERYVAGDTIIYKEKSFWV